MKKFSTWLKKRASRTKSYYRFEILRKAYILKEDLDDLVKEYVSEEIMTQSHGLTLKGGDNENN